MVNDYDSFAEAYSAENEASLINAYDERPAMLALAGDVAGRRILDAGCGSGPLFAALRDRGAFVTGFDSSAGMLDQAWRRLGDDADLRVAALGSPLPFADGTFDDVTASLVLHYLEDWAPALAEVRCVLKPGGRLIVSVDHPFATTLMHREAGRNADYFATCYYTFERAMGGLTVPMCFWQRPLHAMADAFTAAGFRVAVISEPVPAPAKTYLNGGADPGNVVSVPQTYNQYRGAGGHTAAMPEGLAEFFVKACSPPDGVVVDPFAGSGTTAVVARRLGRRAGGLEIHETFVTAAQERPRLGETDNVPVVIELAR